MIPKQGTKRRWHFAHENNHGNCSYETYLHKIAKQLIRCNFIETKTFKISFYQKSVCSIEDCPLGKLQHCSWCALKSYDLKTYYDKCEEETAVEKYRADLVLTSSHHEIDPILIEICVSHKSTSEKLNSGYRIIEIRIDSEEDIRQIISTSMIIESDSVLNQCRIAKNHRVKFYNFKETMEVPDYEHQLPKFRFWVDSYDNIRYDNFDCDHSIRCLTPNPDHIKNAKFLIESPNPIDWDFALSKLSQSDHKIKSCFLCHFYRWNEYHCKNICILYKSKKTEKHPRPSNAKKCPDFKQKCYDEKDIDTYYNEECKITIRNQESTIL